MLGRLKLLKISKGYDLTGESPISSSLIHLLTIFILITGKQMSQTSSNFWFVSLQPLSMNLLHGLSDSQGLMLFLPQNSGINCAVIALQRLHLDIVFGFQGENSPTFEGMEASANNLLFWDHSVNHFSLHHLYIYLWCSYRPSGIMLGKNSVYACLPVFLP